MRLAELIKRGSRFSVSPSLRRMRGAPLWPVTSVATLTIEIAL